MQGTWLHEDVALEFARWLSPAFAIWCNDRIKELLKHGATATNPDDLLNPDFIIGLANQLKKERAEKEQLKVTADLQAKQLTESAPKIIYADTVINSGSLIPITAIAKELGTSAVLFNKLLHAWGVIYRVGQTWVLYDKYRGKGYTGNVTHTYKDSNGKDQTSIQMCWTENGRRFLHSFMRSHRERFQFDQYSMSSK